MANDFVNQWRLATLFLISGMGTRFALSKRTKKEYILERVKRLFIPLVFGILIIVPPQVYIERVAYNGYEEGFVHFLLYDFFNGIYPIGNFSWHHLWFLPYLLLFSLILTPIFIYLRDHPEANFLRRQRSNLQASAWNLYRYAIPLFLIEVIIEPFFNVTHALIDDWFSIALFITIFFYGFTFISIGEKFWKAIDQVKQKALYIGVVAFSLYFWIRHQEDGLLVHVTEGAIKTINFWSWMIVIFGFGAKYLNRPSKLLSYCNTAVYPFYIFHQTVTIVLGYFLYEIDMSVSIKFILLTIGTFLITAVLYEVTRRINFLRPLIGLK